MTSCVILCLIQVGNDKELDTVGRQFEPYRWRLRLVV